MISSEVGLIVIGKADYNNLIAERIPNSCSGLDSVLIFCFVDFNIDEKMIFII